MTRVSRAPVQISGNSILPVLKAQTHAGASGKNRSPCLMLCLPLAACSVAQVLRHNKIANINRIASSTGNHNVKGRAQ